MEQSKAEIAELKKDFDELPFTESEEQLDIIWNQIDKYRITNGNYINANWFYEARFNVSKSEKYILNGTSYYEKCLYYIENTDGNIIEELHFSGENAEHKDISITIPIDGTSLVLQSNANDRVKYKLIKVGSYELDKKSVSYDSLAANVTDKFPDIELVNIFNINDSEIITGKYLNTNGSFTNSDQMCVSGFIEIEPNVEYEFPVYTNMFGVSSCKYVVGYRADKSFGSVLTGIVDETKRMVKFTNTNEFIKYIRVNFANVGSRMMIMPTLNRECFMVTKSPYPSEFIPFGEIGHLKSNIHVSKKNEKRFNPLFRETAIFTGDSICNGASAQDNKNGWSGRVGKNNEMMYLNKGISGATFTDNIGSSGCIANTDFGINPKYIIIEGGTNDADMVGSILNKNIPTKFGSYSMTDYTSDFDKNTYCGAVESLFKRVTTDYKGAKIGVIIAPKMGKLHSTVVDYTKEHNNRRAYFETLMILCRKWGIPYLNLWDESILNPMNPMHYTQGENYYYTDGQHLTTNGYDYISPKIEAWMKTL